MSAITQAQKKLGDRGVSFFDEELYSSAFNIVAKQELIREHPEKVKKMLRALIRAEEFVREKPVEAQRIVADFGRLDMALVQAPWADTTFRVGLDQALVLALEDESRWAIKGGLTAQRSVPNYLDFIHFDALMAVKPEAVRVLR